MKRWWWIAVTVAALPPFTEAGRPLAVDDASTVANGDVQIEAGVGFVRDGATHHFDFPFSVSYGVVPTLQVGAGFGGQLEERLDDNGNRCTESGLGDLVLATKWNPLSAERFWADHSMALAVKFPTADCDKGLGSGETDVDLTYIATKSLGQKLNADLNLGYTWVGGDADVLHYGLALRWQAKERLELVGEIFADTPLGDGNTTAVTFNGGLRWQIVDGLVLDAAAGAGLRGDAPDWTATVGLTWTFGFNNKPKTTEK